MEDNKVVEKKKTDKKTTTTRRNTGGKKSEPTQEGGFTPEQMTQMQQMMGMMFQTMMQNIQKPNPEEMVEEKPEVKKVLKNDKYTKAMLAEIQDEKVVVTSLDKGIVFNSPKTQIIYRWAEKGDIEIMTVGEILAMERVSKKFLHDLWLKIEDVRVIQALNLEELYSLVEKIEDVENLSGMNYQEVKSVIDKLPKGYISLFRDNIYVQAKSGDIRDIVLLSTLGDLLETDFKNL